jgi:hypothetical protein
LGEAFDTRLLNMIKLLAEVDHSFKAKAMAEPPFLPQWTLFINSGHCVSMVAIFFQ